MEEKNIENFAINVTNKRNSNRDNFGKPINTTSKIIPIGKRLSIIVPCYNEEKGINNLHSQLIPVLDKLEKDWHLELIFVDDGSTDATNQLLREKFSSKEYVKIIKHEVNKNLGAAMRTGFAAADGDVVVTMDSDCTYDPEDIFALLKQVEEGADIATASPYHPLGKVENIPGYRLLLSKAISFIYRMMIGVKIYTFTALFRAHKKEVAKLIKFKSDNFLATAEVLIYALMKGYHVAEVPSTLHVRKYGVSKMRLLMVIKSHFIFVIKLIRLKLKRWFA